MPAYNFQARFATDVESGAKRQTIRAEGKRRHAQLGEHLQLYTGMRTKSCRKLISPDPVCIFSAPVFISHGIGSVAVLVEAEEGCGAPNPDEFARADGFVDFDEMLEWFKSTHGLPFVGRLIKW